MFWVNDHILCIYRLHLGSKLQTYSLNFFYLGSTVGAAAEASKIISFLPRALQEGVKLRY